MTLRTRSYVYLLLLIFGPSTLLAQQMASITGTITNETSSAPIAGAVVVLEIPGAYRQTLTGSDGKFSFTNVAAGTYHLTVRADGFAASKVDATVGATSSPLDVKLVAQPHYTEVVSVSPDARSQLDSYQPTNVLGGQDLATKLQSTLGATLANEPGVALRSFGPGPARPVIRGLDGDRVLVLEDGQRMGDLSSQSGDHGINVNPASASKIEVVRGPATLLYGANAIGGLVNVITNSIQRTPVHGATGMVTLEGGSAAKEGGGSAGVTLGNGRAAFHLSGSGHRAGNYTTPDGEVDNSFNRAGYVESGLSLTGEHGYVGGSFAYDRTHYGIPLVEAGETNLNPRRKIFDLRGERTNLGGPISSFRMSLGVRRYQHDELDGEEVATSFINNTSEFEVLAAHRPAGRIKGSIGASFLTRDFSTAGEEVLSPEVTQKGGAVFLYEEATLTSRATFQFGGRIDQANFTPKEDAVARKFTNFSGSVGLVVHPNNQTSVAFSLARASRNPALEELYFHGPHGGNAAVENGDDSLLSEHATGFDSSVRFATSRANAEVTYFYNHVNHFIFRQLTGEVDDDLAVTFFTQGNATLQGVESHVDVRVGSLVWLEAGLDTVRGTLTALDKPLPRMPPVRGRFGVRVQKNALEAGFNASFTAKQDRIFTVASGGTTVGETATDGYNLLKVFLAYSFTSGKTTNTLAVRLDNATNELYHNHLNYLKDLAPEVGRDFRVTYTTRF